MQMQTTSIRIHDTTMQAIQEIAKKKKRKVTEMLRIIIEDYVEKVNL